jgi:hypothetical protein
MSIVPWSRFDRLRCQSYHRRRSTLDEIAMVVRLPSIVKTTSSIQFWNDGNRAKRSLTSDCARLSGLLPINADVARNRSRSMQWCKPSNADTEDDLRLLDLTTSVYLDNERWMRMSLSQPPERRRRIVAASIRRITAWVIERHSTCRCVASQD